MESLDISEAPLDETSFAQKDEVYMIRMYDVYGEKYEWSILIRTPEELKQASDAMQSIMRQLFTSEKRYITIVTTFPMVEGEYSEKRKFQYSEFKYISLALTKIRGIITNIPPIEEPEGA